MDERRKAHRGRTYLGSQVAFYNRYCTMDCLVRNMSQDGAKLVFASPVTIPGEFDLTIAHKGHSRRAHYLAQRDGGRRRVPAVERRVRRLDRDRSAVPHP